MTSKAEASFVCKSFGGNLLPDKAPQVGMKTVLKKKQARVAGQGGCGRVWQGGQRVRHTVWCHVDGANGEGSMPPRTPTAPILRLSSKRRAMPR